MYSPSTSSLSIYSDDPSRCLHIRLLHSKCGHISFLECHETPCTVRHMGWVPEESPIQIPNACYMMKSYIRIKDEYCKSCKLYLAQEEKEKEKVGRGWGWFGKTKVVVEKENPILPQDVIDVKIAEFKILIEEREKRKMRRREGEERGSASSVYDEQGFLKGSPEKASSDSSVFDDEEGFLKMAKSDDSLKAELSNKESEEGALTKVTSENYVRVDSNDEEPARVSLIEGKPDNSLEFALSDDESDKIILAEGQAVMTFE